MGMEDLLKIVFGVTASSCIASTIILFILKLIFEKFATYLEKKHSRKFEEQLEKYKSSLDGKNYISKVQFDIEFAVIKELTKNFFNMLVKLDGLYTSDYDLPNMKKCDDKQAVSDFFYNAGKSVVSAQDSLHENKAFISKIIYEKFKGVYDEAFKLFWEYKNQLARTDYKDTIQNEQWNKEREEKVSYLQDKLDILNDELREYLYNLKIVD